jgi:PDZ domain/Aspartyl protease
MKKYPCLRCGLVLLALVVPAPAADTRPDVKADKAVVVPFELTPTGHMTVMVKVNGKGPYKLIFDTGAPINLINNKVAREAGLLKGVKRPLLPLFGTMGDVKVQELEVGTQKAEDVTAIIMDHPTVQLMSDAFGPIEGIVGFPFFARFKTTLDYQAKTMTLVPSGFKPPDVLQSMQQTMMAMLSAEQAPVVLSSPSVWGMTVEKKKGDEEAGVTVTKVLAGGPAAAAGLKEGDRLLTVDGRWTDSVADTFTAAAAVKPGSEAPVVVQRDGKETTLKVKPLAGL